MGVLSRIGVCVHLSVVCCKSFCYLLRMLLLLSVVKPSVICCESFSHSQPLPHSVFIPHCHCHRPPALSSPVKIRRRFDPKPAACFVSLSHSVFLHHCCVCSIALLFFCGRRWAVKWLTGSKGLWLTPFAPWSSRWRREPSDPCFWR